MAIAARTVAAVALAFVVGACELVPSGVVLRTASAPAQACQDALLVGRLVRHPASGLGIASPEGELTAVEWPFGFGTRAEPGRVALVDERGQVVAHEGDEIQIGGGFGTRFWHACGPVSLVVPEG